MNNAKHCLPILEESLEGVKSRIATNKEYDYFELWLDYLDSFSNREIMSLINSYPDKLILVSRRLQLEPMKRSFEERMLLTAALSTAPAYIDFDIHAQKEELELARKEQYELKKIISYHNYKSTPEDDYLHTIFNEMDMYAPTISKAACYCQKPADAIRLLSLLSKKSAEQEVIILGMGSCGLPTRVFGCSLGNAFTFSPVMRSDESAPGQLTRDELIGILEVLSRAG